MTSIEITKIQRSFYPGDEWLYFKIYLGKFSANKLITDVLFTVAENLVHENICSKWFFIRYSDPNHHIRFRLKLSDVKHYHTVLHKIRESLTLYIASRVIWKIQIDTYEREIERYGKNRMLLSEDLFYENSKVVSHILQQESNELRLILCSVHLIKHLISQLDDFDDKAFLTQNVKYYREEFEVNKVTLKLLAKEFINFEKDFVSFKQKDLYKNLLEINQIYVKQIKQIYDLEKNISANDFDSFLSSHIHMFINRLFSERQRQFELIVYEYISRMNSSSISNRDCRTSAKFLITI